MSWLVDLRRFAKPRPDQIGPGRLILVVGPSGAGKDTLIEGAKAGCANDSTVVFPRRVITRPSSHAEDHDTASERAFNQLVADGEFALWWNAHGNYYGIPASIDDHVRAGRTVVCNVSRTIIGLAKRRYAAVTVILVTAPAKVLEARLACRNRASDGSLAERLARERTADSALDADVVIRNVARPETGVRRLLNVIQGQAYFVVS